MIGRKFARRGAKRSQIVNHKSVGLPHNVLYLAPPCSTRSPLKLRPRPRNSRTCGGFFDVPGAQKRLGELNALMAAESFWNNREQAQKLIDEANGLRNRIEPLLKAEKQV